MEHLRRVLLTLDVPPAPLERLVRLFGSARFSAAHLTTEHRDRALAALEEVARELHAPASTGAPGSVGDP